MRICICEDDRNQSDYYRKLISDFEQRIKQPQDVTTYASGEEMLFESPSDFPYDLIFLDIHMDRVNGMELAKEIRKHNQFSRIVFITGYRDFVFDGYLVNAFRYLLKPIRESDFLDVLNSTFLMAQKADKFLLVKSPEDTLIPVPEILYAEAMGHSLDIVTKSGSFRVKQPLSDLLRRLPETFMLVHRSYVVNLEQVVAIGRTTCRMRNQTEIPVSRANYRTLNEKFLQLFRNVIT